MIPAQNCFEPVMVEANGAHIRAARFAAFGTRRGVCVLLNGASEFIEKYFEVIDELRTRGFAVATMDWRGQGGSARLLKQAPLKGFVRDFADYDSDLDAFLTQMVEPMLEGGERPVALAHSMGGHILLRYLQRHPDRIKAAAFSAPMVKFSTGALPAPLVRGVTGVMMALGRGEDFIWGGPTDPLQLSFDKQIVTSDAARFQRNTDLLKANPCLRLSGPTWRWVAAAFHSQDGLDRAEVARAIATPVLICGAGRDRVVVTTAARRFARDMPDALYREIEGAEHEILMERDVFRAQFWESFDAFMAD